MKFAFSTVLCFVFATTVYAAPLTPLQAPVQAPKELQVQAPVQKFAVQKPIQKAPVQKFSSNFSANRRGVLGRMADRREARLSRFSSY